ncbi:SPRY-domain-containing protein [Gigaspora margarita]|uniref:SPRY-domain-containing protein n=1 Tax=Gigaspora margarita TaxID=4874 RepID=A0A8H4EI66_GIGMA|nr:SPRY-domain-containing protein [Gigaspora margarita]KAF0497705.1 SPRY-domain-containing protein [Gigaspora margarita]
MQSEEFLPSYLHNNPISKYIKNAHKSHSLPTHWNSMDCWTYINVMDQNNLKIEYNGPGENFSDEASIRTNNPIPSEVGLFYFEITILSSGENGCIVIGYCKSDVELNTLPGWDPDSIGYHGDDGCLYYNGRCATTLAPCYAAGDTVGCGINFFNMEIFFTKNGIIIGKGQFIHFETYSHDNNLINYEIVREMYPMCGMSKNGECIVANFGTKPFMFNIDNYAEVIFANVELKST